MGIVKEGRNVCVSSPSYEDKKRYKGPNTIDLGKISVKEDLNL